jgi:hypothetical protein
MFLLLIPVALVLVVVAVLGFAGFGPLTSERRADRDGVFGAIGPAVGLLIGILLIVVSVFGSVLLVGFDGGGDDEEVSDAPAPAAVATTTTAPSSTRVAAPRPIAALGPRVILVTEADDASFPASYPVVDQLRRETVLQMTVHGFETFARVTARQCAPTVIARCFNPIPVQADEDGVARFQYLVTADFAFGRPVPGRCRAGTAPCTIVVSDGDGDSDDRARIQTIFGDTVAPPGRIAVSRADGLSLDGATITVSVTDYPPGAEVFAMLCAAPDAAGRRCGAPGPQAPLIVGADGTGSTKLVVEPGPVGTAGAACTRGSDCGISVAAPGVFARAPVVPISFAGRGGASYDAGRLALGLAVALLLVGIAAWLILRSDWAAVGEAAAPEIDDAEYADLDAIIAALPPEEDDELVSLR